MYRSGIGNLFMYMSGYSGWGRRGWRGGRGGGYGGGRGYGRGYRGGRGAGPWGSTPSQLNVPPPPPGAIRVAVLVDADMGMDSPVSPVFARAPYIAIVDIAGNNVADLTIMPNPVAYGGGGAGPAMVSLLTSIGASIVIGGQPGPNAMGALTATGIRHIPAPPGTPLRNALRIAGFTIA